MTTASTNNSFVKDDYLYIVPMLTSDQLGSNARADATRARQMQMNMLTKVIAMTEQLLATFIRTWMGWLSQDKN
jgi:hypothetical protein